MLNCIVVVVNSILFQTIGKDTTATATSTILFPVSLFHPTSTRALNAFICTVTNSVLCINNSHTILISPLAMLTFVPLVPRSASNWSPQPAQIPLTIRCTTTTTQLNVLLKKRNVSTSRLFTMVCFPLVNSQHVRNRLNNSIPVIHLHLMIPSISPLFLISPAFLTVTPQPTKVLIFRQETTVSLTTHLPNTFPSLAAFVKRFNPQPSQILHPPFHPLSNPFFHQVHN